MKITTRKQAKEMGIKHYFTGKACKYGHTSKRLTSTGQCSECIRKNHYTWYKNNKQQALDAIKNWQQNNKDKVNHYTRNWRKNNPLNATQTNLLYYTLNKKVKLSYNKEWRTNNKSLLQHYNAKRRSDVIKATPKWANTDAIKQIYTNSVELNNNTGVQYHVDHIIPLKGKNVCGLHCESNLQIITSKENMSKGNKFTANSLTERAIIERPINEDNT